MPFPPLDRQSIGELGDEPERRLDLAGDAVHGGDASGAEHADEIEPGEHQSISGGGRTFVLIAREPAVPGDDISRLAAVVRAAQR